MRYHYNQQNYQETYRKDVEYVHIIDSTISGSRNGIATLFMWYRLKTLGKEKIKEQVKTVLEIAQYAVKIFNEAGIKAWRNEFSNTVIFEKPSEKTIKKWSLAEQGDSVHLITMQHVTKEILNTLLKECLADKM